MHALVLSSIPFVSLSSTPTSHKRSVHVRGKNLRREGPHEDTRIHWKSPDEGWIVFGDDDGEDDDTQASSSSHTFSSFSSAEGMLRGLISQDPDSHYRFLGVSSDADLEEIKSAYRKLSKQYHPDSTSLPLDIAADKFVRLREAYDVLSNKENRRFYNWTLAQKVSQQQGGPFVWPYATKQSKTEARPSWKSENPRAKMKDGNMRLSDQAQTALAFDLFALIFSICTIIYVTYFKHG